VDKRWQLVLDCLNCETPPLGKPTLIRFTNRLIKKELDRRLIDRTVEIAKQKGGFGSSQLKAALNSSPLWGSGNIMSGRFPPLRFTRNQVGAGKPANICQQSPISKTRPAGILWSIDRT
jgi:hypothetical protein